MEAVIFPLTAFILFVYFSEIVSFNIVYENELIIDIDFFILGIRLYPLRNSSADRNKKSKKGKDSYNKKRNLSEIINRIIPSSEVSINYLYIALKSKNCAQAYIKKGALLFLANSAMKILEARAKKFIRRKIFIDSSDHTNSNELILSATVKLPLYVLVSHLFVIAKEKLFRFRKETENVGI